MNDAHCCADWPHLLRFAQSKDDLLWADNSAYGEIAGRLQGPPYASDCGLDLVTTRDELLRPGQTRNIPCGVSVSLPRGTFGWITARSSTWTKHGVLVIPGIIDEGWRGELLTLVYKPAADDMPHEAVLRRGTRLSQLIVLPNLLQGLHVTKVGCRGQLPASDRGERGFGSSG